MREVGSKVFPLQLHLEAVITVPNIAKMSGHKKTSIVFDMCKCFSVLKAHSPQLYGHVIRLVTLAICVHGQFDIVGHLSKCETRIVCSMVLASKVSNKL